MTPNSPLDSVYFIDLPENFKLSKDSFHIDPTIPLPVQKKDNDSAGSFNMAELTEEQILAGILTILAYDKNNQYIQYYRSILKNARPNLKKELSEAAILKAKNEDFDIAEEIFSALRGFDPEDMAILLNTALFLDQRAESYRRSGLIEDADAYDEDALNLYKEAMEAEPPLPDAFFNAGFFYLKQRKYKEAKDAFETYIALTCEITDEELGENGVYKKNRAQEVLNEIKNRNMEDDHFRAAYDLISRGEEEKGLEEIRLFLQRNPEVWNAWFMLGWGLRRLGRFEDAKQSFLKALECEGGSENVDCYNELAICYMETGELKQSELTLEKALVIDSENTKIISNLGFLALKENDISKAQGYFQTVLEIDPDDKIALAQMAQLEAL